MRIGIIGGTGDIGEGMAMRLSQKHDVILGSRDPAKSEEASRCCYITLADLGLPCSCRGVTNQEAVDFGDIVILAVPFKHLEGTLNSVHGLEGKVVVSPVNPMEKTDHFINNPPPEGSAALLVQKLLPGSKVCAAFNVIAANRWKKIEEELDYAVPVCGDDLAAKSLVMDLVNGVSHLKAYDAGPLESSSLIECITPLLLNIARYNKMKDVGIQFI
ncbi:NADPH-dependent F420 reductase [Methanosphaerula subterraneus]|uniref:NADPH-dependent F420 reductase n=1 Tax=Methanosphaerula subterraneus TaxID=3350244 RepID=UPI003F874972